MIGNASALKVHDRKPQIPPSIRGELKSNLDDKIRSMFEHGWTGLSQKQFTDLVTDWTSKYPPSAARLVSGEFKALFSMCSDETRYALFYVLQHAAKPGPAEYALNVLALNGRVITNKLEATNSCADGESKAPKYTMHQKITLLSNELSIPAA